MPNIRAWANAKHAKHAKQGFRIQDATGVQWKPLVLEVRQNGAWRELPF